MIEIIKELNIEVSKPNVFQAVVAKQYDMNTRFIKATFVDDGNKIYIDPTATVDVVINALRPDGESKGFDGVVNQDGTVTVPLHSWMLELVGAVTCDISVIDIEAGDNKKLTTTSFTLHVEKAAYGGDDITSDPQYDVLVQLIEDCSAAAAMATKTGQGAPTTATEGVVGCLYMDTDTGNMYKCTAVDGGVYTWVSIVDDIILVEEGITNLFNKDDPDVDLDKWIEPKTGTFYAAQAYNTSGYVPIENGKTYTFPVASALYGWKGTGYVALFDASKAYVGYASGTITNDLLTVTINQDNAVYLRTTKNLYGGDANFNWGKMMIVEGTEYPSEYIAYGEYKGGKSEFNGEIALSQKHVEQVLRSISPLHGKRVVFAGDSICHALTDDGSIKGWAGRIGTKHEMDWTNAGISGATITSKAVTGAGGCIADTNFGENPDYIIIEGGTNDADLIGEGTGENMPTSFGTYSVSNYGEFNTDTFCGAVEHLFKRVTTDYPGAKIGFIIAHKMGYYVGEDGTNTSYNYGETNNRRFYFDTIIKLCKKWGIPYIDLWYGCYLNPMNTVHRTGDDPFYYNGDGQHLTAKGYDYISPMIEKWMETL